MHMDYTKKLVLVDGHALIHRAYHALPNLSNSQGFPTGAVFGFFSILFKALADIKPTHLLVTLDQAGPTFRHKLAADYKGTRKPMEDDLARQIPVIAEILGHLNIPIYMKEGYEADDLLGIISAKSPKDMFNVILTGDLDMLQLINPKTHVYRLKTGISEMVVFDEAAMIKAYGLKPTQWVDYKALKGDPSDNIPGVPGVGEKTALVLIQEFGSLEGVYDEAESDAPKIKSGVVAKLLAGKDKALLSRQLAQISTSNNLKVNFEEAELSDYNQEKVIQMFQELGIKALIPRLPKTSVAMTPTEDIVFSLVDTKEEIQALVQKITEGKKLAISTVGEEEGNLLGISFSTGINKNYYLPVSNTGRKTFELLKPYLENQDIEKYGHNLKFDWHSLKKYGVNLLPFSFDVAIAAYLLNPGQRGYELEDLSFAELGVMKRGLKDILGEGRKKQAIGELEKKVLSGFACENAECIFSLKLKLEALLKESNLFKIFNEIEMPLSEVLAQMEAVGIKIDKEYLVKLSNKAGTELASLEKQIYKLAGMEFNVSSPIQLREVLFDKLQIPSETMKKRGKSGELSTAATQLEKLRGLHPIVELIFDYRELAKLKSTYLDALPQLVSEADGRLHTTYNQTIAATGRLSSTDPNLKNIPIRTELGNAVRKAFVADERFDLVSLDYSQIELRIAASLAHDSEMIKIFNAGGDFHQATAAKIFNVPEDKVTKEQRRDAKTINFSVLYGVSAFGLSERSDMGRAEAGDYIKKYFEVFSGLKKYVDETIKLAHAQGYLLNPLGRIRRFPEINSSNFAVRAAAERAAVNMPIQSLAADIMKMAMIEIDKFIRHSRGSLPAGRQAGIQSSGSPIRSGMTSDPEARMLLSVHDELVFEIEKQSTNALVPKIKNIMESVYKLEVPLVAEAKIGKNWMEMIPYEREIPNDK